MIASTYHERGQPIRVLARWLSRARPGSVDLACGAPARGTPRNVLVRRKGDR